MCVEGWRIDRILDVEPSCAWKAGLFMRLIRQPNSRALVCVEGWELLDERFIPAVLSPRVRGRLAQVPPLTSEG